MSVRRIAVVFCGFLVVAGTGCSVNFSSSGFSFDFKGEKASRKVDAEISANVRTVNIRNVHGNVTVLAASEDTGAVSWELTCWSDTKEGATRNTELVKFVNSTEGDVYNCEVVLPESGEPRLRGVKSNFTISLPASVEINVVNSHGDVEASGLASAANLENSHGEMKVRDLAGSCTLKNSHGDILATHLAGAEVKVAHGDATISTVAGILNARSQHGRLNVESVQGDVELKSSHDDIEVSGISGNTFLECSHGDIFGRQLMGASVVAEASHGDIDLQTMAASLDCTTQHGDVTVSATNPKLKTIDIEASFDDITLTLPSGLNPDIESSVSFGDVKSDFKGDGTSPRINLSVKHGDITIRKQALAEKE